MLTLVPPSRLRVTSVSVSSPTLSTSTSRSPFMSTSWTSRALSPSVAMVRGAPNAGGAGGPEGKEPRAAGGFTSGELAGIEVGFAGRLESLFVPEVVPEGLPTDDDLLGLVGLEGQAPAAIDGGHVPLEPVREAEGGDLLEERPGAREVLGGLRFQDERVRESELGRCVVGDGRQHRFEGADRGLRVAVEHREARAGVEDRGGPGGQILRAAGGRRGEVEVAEAQGDLGLGDEIRGRGVVALEERRELVEGLAELLLREVNGHPFAAQHGLGGGLTLGVESHAHAGLGVVAAAGGDEAQGKGEQRDRANGGAGASGRGAVRGGASCHGADPGGSRGCRLAAAGGAALVFVRVRRSPARRADLPGGRACVRTRGCATIRAMSTSNDAARRAGHGLPFVGTLLWVMTAAVTLWLVRPPAPLDADASPDEAAAGRALQVLERIARDEDGSLSPPRPPGSAANARCRERILAELRRLGLEPEVQEIFGAYPRQGVMGTARNVVAVLPGDGTRRGGSGRDAILCMAHHDSVFAGPGIGDDLAGVAAWLEVARALASGPALERDVILLFEDGEEQGLLGAELFAEHHPLSARVGAVVNLEGRGNAGPSRMFETGPRNRWAVESFAGESRAPSASSASVEVYRRMPNDTDYTVWRSAACRA